MIMLMLQKSSLRQGFGLRSSVRSSVLQKRYRSPKDLFVYNCLKDSHLYLDLVQFESIQVFNEYS